jgi:hypothetical protein
MHDSVKRCFNFLKIKEKSKPYSIIILLMVVMFVGVMDTNVPTERGGAEESDHQTFGSNVENTIVKSSMNESSKTSDKLPHNRRRPYHGWIASDDTTDLVCFPLPKNVEKLIGKSVAPERQRRKSRWDERPNNV